MIAAEGRVGAVSFPRVLEKGRGSGSVADVNLADLPWWTGGPTILQEVPLGMG
jgi:hypothetical protein